MVRLLRALSGSSKAFAAETHARRKPTFVHTTIID